MQFHSTHQVVIHLTTPSMMQSTPTTILWMTLRTPAMTSATMISSMSCWNYLAPRTPSKQEWLLKDHNNVRQGTLFGLSVDEYLVSVYWSVKSQNKRTQTCVCATYCVNASVGMCVASFTSVYTIDHGWRKHCCYAILSNMLTCNEITGTSR